MQSIVRRLDESVIVVTAVAAVALSIALSTFVKKWHARLVRNRKVIGATRWRCMTKVNKYISLLLLFRYYRLIL